MEQFGSIKKLRDSGCAPIINLNIFDSIKKLKFADAVLEHHNFTVDMYKEYLDNLNLLGEDKAMPYLKTIKLMEVVDNQVFEDEDLFLISISSQSDETAIDYLLKQDEINKANFIEGHKLLLSGTSNEDFMSKDYRDDDEAYVGYVDNSGIHVDYFPISYTEIDEAIEKLLEFYRSDIFDENMFIKGEIVHALISLLQMFNDGNTRYSRVLQNLKLFELTKKQLDYPYDIPALYTTKSYLPFRYDYRNLIKALAINPSNEQWTKWFNFNLNRAEDTMYYFNEELAKYKKMRL